MELAFDSFALVAATADLADEPAARDHADAVEFRMDMGTDPLAALSGYGGRLPLLVTNRPTWEGGDAAPGSDRVEALERAVEHEAVAAVDVELAALDPDAAVTDPGGADSRPDDRADPAAVRDLVDRARATDTAVVVSTHDFEGTPDRDRLQALLSAAGECGDVAKLAVTADGPGDVLDVLAATWAATAAGETVATMAMGEAGRHSRAVAPLYGSRIGYAPVDPAAATAPGQYDLATLARLVDRLGNG